MKKDFNVIQIKGIRGLLLIGFAIMCLVVGFGAFPGWLIMKAWNFVSSYYIAIPQIAIFQGILFWGIIVVSYFTFRKEKLIVCMKGSQGLTEEELKKVFGDLKRQANEDKIIQAMLKAKELEVKINENSSNVSENTDEKSINNDEQSSENLVSK